ncbi:quinone oxidoreductase family protein [Nocardia macrotermitis]|uniref:Enoyl reductase (ER) domain-containing protein n=1 Tax=Nocardia macrotermitis TaxID=2585198 RepID=A0A7K0D521_9NOCA|nr:zinc-binding alcohol dehydrogenase family protein [Nocardia macrotermitis]MQY20818.1 hypothetical protein [Nocardia macrotermitis]
MKAAILHTYGEPPRYGEFREPEPREGEQLVEVTAAALTNLARSRAAGTHYSDHGELPAIVGVDGVGVLADGRRVFFTGPREPFGSMAQRSLASRRTFPVPDGLDDLTAAALLNPGVSAWTSLAHRAELRPGERVLILGATGVTGKLAVQAARSMGAGEIVAAGRNRESLRRVGELGADVTIELDQDPGAAFAEAVGDKGFDVVIDYLWGPPIEALLGALGRADLHAASRRTRLVHVGGMAGPSITLPGSALRSSDLVIIGTGTGSWNPVQLAESVEHVMRGAVAGELTIDARPVPLAEVESVWNLDGKGTRTVLIP